MKKIVLLFAIALSLFSFTSCSSEPEGPTLTIKNNTGTDIYFLLVTSSEAEEWDYDVDDVLGDDVMEQGDSVTISLEQYDFDLFDIMAEDPDENTITIYDMAMTDGKNTIELKAADFD